MRRLFELFAERDRAGVSELLAPDVVWFGTRGGLDANRVSRGSEAFLDYIEEIDQTWEELDVDVERLIASDETVVVFLNERARGRGAVDVHSETAMVCKTREGKIAEVRGYLDRGEALKAAGLSE